MVDTSIASVKIIPEGLMKTFFGGSENIEDKAYNKLGWECSSIMQLKGIKALRLSYLFGGLSDKIPPREIFSHNHYKNYEIPDLSVA